MNTPASLPRGVEDSRRVSCIVRRSPAGLRLSRSRGSPTCTKALPVLAPCPSFSLSRSLLVFPGTASQVNYLCWNPCFRVCFWEDLN